MNVAVAINVLQRILLSIFLSSLWFLPEDDWRSPKHVAEIKKLYLYLDYVQRSVFKTGNTILLYGMNNIRAAYIDRD